MLSIRNLSFHYRPGFEILKGASFELPEGQVLCLLGANGAGKTTLMKCLLGLLRPTGGDIHMLGGSLLDLPAKKRARMIAYVAQTSALNFPYTVREAILMGRIPHLGFGKAPTAADHSAVDSALEEMGISDLANRVLQQLSGGERQLVMIARALVQQAHLLILDEPTSNLDFANQAHSLNVVRRLAQRGHTILLTTHSPDQAFLIADQVIMLQQGRILAQGHPEAVITGQSLSDLYGMKAVVSETSVVSAGRHVKVCVPLLDDSP